MVGIWCPGNGVVFYQVLERDVGPERDDETFFEECVAEVHGTTDVAFKVAGSRTERRLDDDGKRGDTSLETMRVTLWTHGAQESTLMFK
jgi:hypothetical protein